MFRVLPKRPFKRTETSGIPAPARRGTRYPSYRTVEGTHPAKIILLMKDYFDADGDGTLAVGNNLSPPQLRMITFKHYTNFQKGDAMWHASAHVVVRLYRIVPVTATRLIIITRDEAGTEYQDYYTFRSPPRLPDWYVRLLGATSPVA